MFTRFFFLSEIVPRGLHHNFYTTSFITVYISSPSSVTLLLSRHSLQERLSSEQEICSSETEWILDRVVDYMIRSVFPVVLSWHCNIVKCFESALLTSTANSQKYHASTFFSTLTDCNLPWHFIYTSNQFFFSICLLSYTDKTDVLLASSLSLPLLFHFSWPSCMEWLLIVFSYDPKLLIIK